MFLETAVYSKVKKKKVVIFQIFRKKIELVDAKNRIE